MCQQTTSKVVHSCSKWPNSWQSEKPDNAIPLPPHPLQELCVFVVSNAMNRTNGHCTHFRTVSPWRHECLHSYMYVLHSVGYMETDGGMKKKSLREVQTLPTFRLPHNWPMTAWCLHGCWIILKKLLDTSPSTVLMWCMILNKILFDEIITN